MTLAGGDRASQKAVKNDSKLVRCTDHNLFVDTQIQIKFSKKRMFLMSVVSVNRSHHVTEVATALVRFHIQLIWKIQRFKSKIPIHFK